MEKDARRARHTAEQNEESKQKAGPGDGAASFKPRKEGVLKKKSFGRTP